MALRTFDGLLEATSLGTEVGKADGESLAITLGIRLGAAEGSSD